MKMLPDLAKSLSYFALAKLINPIEASPSSQLLNVPQNKNSAMPAILEFKLSPAHYQGLQTHGCWCSQIGGDSNIGVTGGQAFDDLDVICKNWIKTRRCNDNLFGGSCNLIDSGGLYYHVEKSSNGTVACTASSTNDDDPALALVRSGDKELKVCESDSCIIDNQYSENIKQFLIENSGHNFQRKLCRKMRSLPGTQQVLSCSGSAPDLHVQGSSRAVLTNPRFLNGEFYSKGRKWNLAPEHAIDGIIKADDVYNSMACSSGQEPGSNEFMVDLTQPCPISKIVIYPRRDNRCPKDDYCQSRYRRMIVRLDGPEGAACQPVAEFRAGYVLDHFDDGLEWICPKTEASSIFIENGNDYTQVVEIEATCGF